MMAVMNGLGSVKWESAASNDRIIATIRVHMVIRPNH